MVDLRNTHKPFSQTLKRSDGVRFKGQISELKTDLGTLRYPARLLKVSSSCPISAGEVVSDPSGLHYILAEHLPAYGSPGLVYTTLRMIRADQTLARSRMVNQKDAVTGLDKGTGSQALGTIRVNVSPIDLIQPAKRFAESKVSILSGDQLGVGDRVGDYTVKFVDTILGVWLAEAV